MIDKLKILAITALTVASFGLPSSHAGTSADFSSGGSVKIGDSVTACTGAIAGALRYETGANIVEVCNGSAWVTPTVASASCTIGDAVGDGICAGQVNGKDIIVTQAGCELNAASAADCDGTDASAIWGYDTWEDGEDRNDHVAAYDAYVAYAAANTLDVSDRAPTICASMTIDGEDWYLPSIVELIIIHQNRNTGSWTNGSFQSNHYLSINIFASGNAEAVDFSTDSDVFDRRSSQFASFPYRCARLQ